MTKLGVHELRWICDPKQFNFKSTAEIEPLGEVIGQERAVRAISFGLGMKMPGYNIFVTGAEGTGRTSIVRDLVEKHARSLPKGVDWCLVNNFEDEFRPRAIPVPSGKALRLSRQMARLMEGLARALADSLGRDAFRLRRTQIEQKHKRRQDERLRRMEKSALAQGVLISRDKSGFQVSPLGPEGVPLTQEGFAALPAKRRAEIDKLLGTVRSEVESVLREAERIETTLRSALEEQTRKAAQEVLHLRFEPLREEYDGWPDINRFFDDLQADVLERIARFVEPEDESDESESEPPPLGRYRVNVLADRGNGRGAPVVFEANPTYANLFGLVERRMQQGNVSADFTMVQAGSLLKANGGFLIIEVEALLMNLEVWEALKRALQNRRLAIEDNAAGMPSVRPQPIPLEVKVILLGGYEAFFVLQNSDPTFNKNFRVRADFDDRVALASHTIDQYAQFVARVCKNDRLLPFSPRGVAAVVEHGAKQAADRHFLSLRLGPILGVVREADYWARQTGARRITDRHVVQAFREHRFRYNLYEERIQEAYREGSLLMSVSGAVAGQVNGLAVHQLGDIAFGRPCRITAETFMGRQGLVNIEREAELSGSSHDKGVLILSGWLGRTFAQRHPLSLTISLAFEQSYDEIEGDSASAAELYAILSSLSSVPIRQAIAVTGSVNQKGQLQAIGGVNQKVEGFFDVCLNSGLTGEQGVLIPRANVRHLMLRRDVVQAAQQGRFHLWSVETVAEGIEVLTGVAAGSLDAEGRYEETSLYGRVARTLETYWQQAKAADTGEEE